MRQQQHRLDELNTCVAVVTFELDHFAQAYVQQTDLSWPLLVDSTRALYRAYGMHRGSWKNIYGPSSWSEYGKLLMRGRTLRKPTGDVHQLGGDVLIDPQGIVRVHHVGSGPADRPSVDSILELVAATD